MNFDFFLKVNQFRVSYGQYASAEDFIDTMNYMLTPMILIFFAGISASKQYLFTPIQCWTVKETESSHRMEYIENLCWIENMYYWPLKNTLPKESTEARERRRIYYYQWVPFVLALQAVLFYLPRMVWLFLSSRFGTSISDIIRFSMSAATVEQDKRQKLVQFLAAHLEKLMFHAQPYRSGRWQTLKRRCAQLLPCLVLTKRTGFVLVGSYLLVKLLYVQNAVLQLAIMQHFLGMNSSDWGVKLLRNLVEGERWERSGIFPRVTRCDVRIDDNHNTNTYTMQCVLPNNMLNEKMYLFLWFWTWAILVLTLASFLSWTVSSTMHSSRRTLLRKYLKIMTTIQREEKALAKKFVNSFLRYDGVFILRMVSHNAGDMLAAEIVREVWLRFRSKKVDGALPELPLLPPDRPPRSASGKRQQQQQQQQQQLKAKLRASNGGKVPAQQQQQQQQLLPPATAAVSATNPDGGGDDSTTYV